MPGMLILLVVCCVVMCSVNAFVSKAKLSINKFLIAPVRSTATTVKSPSVVKACTSLRFLEGNTWELVLGDIKVYIDPIMSQLDFGMPRLYAGNKKTIDSEKELNACAKTADVIFISQAFDDHAHKPTLKRLARMNNNIPYLCPPGAKNILLDCGIRESMITTIIPGETYTFDKGVNAVEVLATMGALLGPPWAAVENGYILKPSTYSKEKFSSIYYEPHCMYNEKELSQYKADIVITPVVAQQLPLFTLVAGGEKAVNLAKILGAKYIVPMRNGGLEQRGILTRLVRANGSEEKFLQLAKEELGSGVEILRAPAGETVTVP